jgi:hypothetical protein
MYSTSRLVRAPNSMTAGSVGISAYGIARGLRLSALREIWRKMVKASAGA